MHRKTVICVSDLPWHARMQRLNQRCDCGTALTAVATVEQVSPISPKTLHRFSHDKVVFDDVQTLILKWKYLMTGSRRAT
jgi:hypothetical protein